MKYIKLAVAGVVAVCLSGCSVPVAYYGVSGSKADGVVTIGYDANDFTIAKHNPTDAQLLAVSKCGGWGYSGAEAFGGKREVRTGEYTKQGLIEFQCK